MRVPQLWAWPLAGSGSAEGAGSEQEACRGRAAQSRAGASPAACAERLQPAAAPAPAPAPDSDEEVDAIVDAIVDGTDVTDEVIDAIVDALTGSGSGSDDDIDGIVALITASTTTHQPFGLAAVLAAAASAVACLV